ncbi:MAG: 4-hydroxy-3-methylbut-2-enyl diphosphate reductase, partial [Bacteroidota bacterium]
MTITIDPHSGFCFGVSKAVKAAEAQLAFRGHLSCLGEIVHNHEEVVRLEKMGLGVISHENFAQVNDTPVLIRA